MEQDHTPLGIEADSAKYAIQSNYRQREFHDAQLLPEHSLNMWDESDSRLAHNEHSKLDSPSTLTGAFGEFELK